MSSRIFSTRNTTRTYLLVNMITTLILDGLIFWWLLKRAKELYATYWYRDEAGTLITLAIMVVVLCLINLIRYGTIGGTYLDIYEGRIRGTGMCGWQRQNFDLRREQVVSLTTSKGSLFNSSNPGMFLIVNTTAGNYKVLTSTECAYEIVAYFNNENVRQY